MTAAQCKPTSLQSWYTPFREAPETFREGRFKSPARVSQRKIKSNRRLLNFINLSPPIRQIKKKYGALELSFIYLSPADPQCEIQANCIYPTLLPGSDNCSRPVKYKQIADIQPECQDTDVHSSRPVKYKQMAVIRPQCQVR